MPRNSLAMSTGKQSYPEPPRTMGKAQKADSANRGELECLRIETAENGFSVEARFEPDKPPTEKNGLPYPSSELMVFETLPNLLKCVAKMLTEQVSYEKGEK